MSLNSHISACATCLAEKVCGLVRSTWGISLGEDKLATLQSIDEFGVDGEHSWGLCSGDMFSPCTASTSIPWHSVSSGR